MKTKVPLEAGAQRLIIATCEKGTVENIEEMRGIKGDLDKIKKANPNFVEVAAKARVPRAGRAAGGRRAAASSRSRAAQKKRAALMKKRAELRIGMPRVLNMYSQTPVFTGYFASLGIKAENIVYSDFTSEELYKEGAKRGAIDPCFPSKLGIPHVHNLLYQRARQEAARHHLLPDDRLPDQRLCMPCRPAAPAPRWRRRRKR